MKSVGIGTRVLNFLIDTILIAVIAMLLARWYNWYVHYYNFKSYNFGWFFWGTLFVYYTLFELILARTPGKFISYSKVVNNKGGRPSIIAVLIRSVIRLTIIDCFFIPFLDKTLHDYFSKTDVVEV